MINTIDGFSFDQPLAESQIIALAQFHRKQMVEAEKHQEIRLGDYCIAQRSRVGEYTRTLDVTQRNYFYSIYDAELQRLGDSEDLHEGHPSGQARVGAVVIGLIVLAVVLHTVFYQLVWPVIH